MTFKLLDTFKALFEGKIYKHRDSSLGNLVASYFFEDLFELGQSERLVKRVEAKDHVVNVQNVTTGKKARRGDGTFGIKVHGESTILSPGYKVARGPIAVIEVGVETKVLAKAMIKQIDRVMNDLRSQLDHFKKCGPNSIRVALVGINWAECYTSYEGDRTYPTTGTGGYKHPCQEAKEAESRVEVEIRPLFDELLFLRYRATNVSPYEFEWVDYARTRQEYSAILTRVSRMYDGRFP